MTISKGEPAGTNRMEYINFNWILAKPHRDLEFTGYSVKMKCMLHVDTHVFTEADEIKGQACVYNRRQCKSHG